MMAPDSQRLMPVFGSSMAGTLREMLGFVIEWDRGRGRGEGSTVH